MAISHEGGPLKLLQRCWRFVTAKGVHGEGLSVHSWDTAGVDELCGPEDRAFLLLCHRLYPVDLLLDGVIAAFIGHDYVFVICAGVEMDLDAGLGLDVRKAVLGSYLDFNHDASALRVSACVVD